MWFNSIGLLESIAHPICIANRMLVISIVSEALHSTFRMLVIKATWSVQVYETNYYFVKLDEQFLTRLFETVQD